MFKPTVDSEENKEVRTSNELDRRRQQRSALVLKKRELAERQAAAAAAVPAAAAHDAPVIPDAAVSNSDEDLNHRIDEIFEEFQNIGGPNMKEMDEEWILFLWMSVLNIKI